jgi:hypothetical protein
LIYTNEETGAKLDCGGIDNRSEKCVEMRNKGQRSGKKEDKVEAAKN